MNLTAQRVAFHHEWRTVFALYLIRFGGRIPMHIGICEAARYAIHREQRAAHSRFTLRIFVAHQSNS